MTLVLNEIHLLDGLKRTVLVAAADRRLTYTDGQVYGTYRKLFRIPYLDGALSYFGLAVFKQGGKLKNLSEWLPAFIRRHSGVPDLRTFCHTLHAELERLIPATVLAQNVSGFQICGYNKDYIPEYWFLTNIRSMNGPEPSEWKSTYKAPAPHFLQNDAKRRFNWDGVNPGSCTNGKQIYRHGDFRGYAAFSEVIDAAVIALAERFPDAFFSPRTLAEYREYVRFKFEFIAYLYKKWAHRPVIGRPIDVLVWTGDTDARSIRWTDTLPAR